MCRSCRANHCLIIRVSGPSLLTARRWSSRSDKRSHRKLNLNPMEHDCTKDNSPLIEQYPILEKRKRDAKIREWTFPWNTKARDYELYRSAKRCTLQTAFFEVYRSKYIDTLMVFAKLRAFNNDTPSPPKTSERRDRKWKAPLRLENALLLKTVNC